MMLSLNLLVIFYAQPLFFLVAYQIQQQKNLTTWNQSFMEPCCRLKQKTNAVFRVGDSYTHMKALSKNMLIYYLSSFFILFYINVSIKSCIWYKPHGCTCTSQCTKKKQLDITILWWVDMKIISEFCIYKLKAN